ncbi:MFS transporter [Egibacter rhizosphaerae]|uniref:MFS transporter n=1 Tax=Egibacter rhizosphaerae TaxID=1670831 RepID=A0A411YJD2_9ACTN|nr:MFS transporter [Egibacter rhizosphaerae]QBI21340.1 MFS transporter [Egibacter rhizosphaerae]
MSAVSPRVSPPLLAAYAITFLAFADTFAFLPTIGPHADDLGADEVMVGVVVGAYSATNLVANPFAGVLLDRLGRRRVLLAGLTLAAVAVACYPLAATPGQLLGIRLVHGIGGGIIVPAVFTLVGDLTRTHRRGRAMGRTGASIGLAAIVGPPLAALMADRVNFEALAISVAGVLLLGLLIAALALPEPQRAEARTDAAPRTALRRLGRASLAAFGFTFALGGLSAFLPFRVEALGAAPAVSGGLLGLFAVVAAVLMLSPLADTSRSVRAEIPLVAGLIAVAIALVALGAGGSVPVLAAGAAVFGVGYALLFPVAAAQAADAVSGARRGRAFGAFHAAFSAGFVLGPPTAGFFTAGPLGPFTAGGVAAVLTALIVPLLRPERTPVGEAAAGPDRSGEG